MSNFHMDDFMDAYFELIKDEYAVQFLETIFGYLPVDFRQTPYSYDTTNTPEVGIQSNVPFKIIATDTCGGFYCMLDDETNSIALMEHANTAGVIARNFREFMHLLVFYTKWDSIYFFSSMDSIQKTADEIMATYREQTSAFLFRDNPYTYQSLCELLIQRLDLRIENYDIARLFELATSDYNRYVKFFLMYDSTTGERINLQLDPIFIRRSSVFDEQSDA